MSLKDKIAQMPLSIEFLHFVCSWQNLTEFEEKLTNRSNFALVGYIYIVPFNNFSLHTCGDFAVMLMESFLKCKNAQLLVSIGCCYHCFVIGGRLGKSDVHHSSHHGYFPLSKYYDSLKASLTDNSLKVATNAREQYCSVSVESDAVTGFSLHWRYVFHICLIYEGLL
jgi:hypothetical protein